MPTSYTAPVMEGNTSVRDYMLNCARAFGAFSQIREDSRAPLDSARKSDVPRIEKNLAEAVARLALVRSTSLDSAKLSMEEAEASQKADHGLRVARVARERANYESVLAEVRAWVAPTPAHEGYKAFLEKQLVDSIEFDCREPGEFKPLYSSPEDYLEAEASMAEREIELYTRRLAEVTAAEESNEAWISDLFGALPAD